VVTGVVLAESHLAVHTWPELGVVTLDVYVCNLGGDHSAQAEALLADLQAAFEPRHGRTPRLHRGAADGARLDLPQVAPRQTCDACGTQPDAEATMRHLALDVIRDEHQALAAMLRSLSLLLQHARREGTLPDPSTWCARCCSTSTSSPSACTTRRKASCCSPRCGNARPS
jgi:hypothetical protein